MNLPYLLLAILTLLFIGYLVWNNGRQKSQGNSYNPFSEDYLLGLNYLLGEQPDKAVDIFIKLLEVDSETVETHLALGHLFRRRGEVDRAIRIHQNLIAKPQLSKKQRTQATLALGEDYLRAGVLDRAERLLLDVVQSGEFQIPALKMLLDIYEQEKEWVRAIQTAEKYQQVSNEPLFARIAHYNCELAIDSRLRFGSEQAAKYLKLALVSDKNCVRASLLQGSWDMEQQDYKQAIKCFRRVADQDIWFLTEVIKPLGECYEKLGQSEEYYQLLHRYQNQAPRLSLVLVLSERILQEQGALAASEFVTEQLYAKPSLSGLSRLIELQKLLSADTAKYNLQLLFNITQQLIMLKPVYRCENCGYAGKVLHWQCPSCRQWGSVKSIQGLEGE
ncbi:MAG: lipopolysaccharide assembly protein LapB [Legionellales bacterium]|nr:lipopolysaccharide assembly protein LapB [Legionellales bacterium]